MKNHYLAGSHAERGLGVTWKLDIIQIRDDGCRGMDGIALAEITPTMTARSLDGDAIPHAADGDMGYTPEIVTFDRDDPTDLGMLIHDGNHAAQIAEPFLTHVAGDEQIDIWSQSCGLQHGRDQQRSGDTQAVVTDARSIPSMLVASDVEPRIQRKNGVEVRRDEQAWFLGEPLEKPDDVAHLVNVDSVIPKGRHSVAYELGSPLLVARGGGNRGNLAGQRQHAGSEFLGHPKERRSDIPMHHRSKLSAPRHAASFSTFRILATNTDDGPGKYIRRVMTTPIMATLDTIPRDT